MLPSIPVPLKLPLWFDSQERPSWLKLKVVTELAPSVFTPANILKYGVQNTERDKTMAPSTPQNSLPSEFQPPSPHSLLSPLASLSKESSVCGSQSSISTLPYIMNRTVVVVWSHAPSSPSPEELEWPHHDPQTRTSMHSWEFSARNR